jgi:hypothetical protein
MQNGGDDPVVAKKDVWDILSRVLIVGLAIAVVGFLAYAAMDRGVDGVGLATATATILGLALAFLGIKVKDVLLK